MAQHTACITLGDNNFEAEVLAYNGFFVVVFGANWRGSCHIIAPVVEQVATAFAGRIRVGWLDIDRHPCVPSRYRIHTVPTLLFFSQGRVVDQTNGVISKLELIHKLETLLDPPGGQPPSHKG